MMNRRDLLRWLGCAVAAPHALRAQQKAMPVIVFLSSRSPEDSAAQVAGFRQGLAELGYVVEGESLAIEYRWALGDYQRPC
jgi:putative ABC transport system substrate-binding protein